MRTCLTSEYGRTSNTGFLFIWCFFTQFRLPFTNQSEIKRWRENRQMNKIMSIFCKNCSYPHGEVEPCFEYEYGEVLKDPSKWYWAFFTFLGAGGVIGTVLYFMYRLFDFLW